MRRRVALIGGYGAIGGALARQLAPTRSLLIAGRSLDKAQRLIDQLPGKHSAGLVDTSDPLAAESLSNEIWLVVLCAPDPGARFTESCIRRGVHVVWITTDFSVERRLSELDTVARNNGARIVRGAGLAPGLTTLLAHDLLKSHPDATRLDFGVQLSLGGKHGGDALDWFLAPHIPKAFGRVGEPSSFIGSDGQRFPVFRFPFPDPFITGARKSGVADVHHWVAPSPAYLNRIVAGLMQSKVFAWHAFRKFVTPLMSSFPASSDICGAFAVLTRNGKPSAQSQIVTTGQSRVTAAMARLVIGTLDRDDAPFGTYDMADVVSLESAQALISELNPKARISIDWTNKIHEEAANAG